MDKIYEIKEEELEKISGGNFTDEYDFLRNKINEGDVFLIRIYNSEFSKPGYVATKTYKDPSDSTNIECVKFDYILDLKMVTHVEHMVTKITYGELNSNYDRRTDINVRYHIN